MRKRVFKTFAAAALATTIAGTTIIGSTAGCLSSYRDEFFRTGYGRSLR